MKNVLVMALMFVMGYVGNTQTNATPGPVASASMNQNTRELLEESIGWETHFWDQDAKLLRNPTPATWHDGPIHYLVRESSWYALALLLRDQPGDRQRAADILDVVLRQQYITPGVAWYGTFKRSPEEPDPIPGAIMWHNYDPNWREFIGTTFELILIEYPDRIPAELSKRMYTAIDRSIEGEIAQHRLVPSYSNIALMYGALWDFAGAHSKRPDWQKASVDWTDSVYNLFRKYDAFNEFNSPTYYGVDLYGLAMWRDYGSTKKMRSMGSEMESTLWREIASFYQPTLRNISGPYDRSYGMDMENYVAVTGVWMRSVLDAQNAPLPKITASTDHIGDLWLAPHIAILGTRIPQDALVKMTAFAGDHLVHKQITEDRIATAWIGTRMIFGGESTSKTKDAGPTSQFHPATVQWRTPSGETGWIRLVESPKVDAIADERGLTISATGTLRFRIHAKNQIQEKITQKDWDLPGLQAAITSDAHNFSIEKTSDGFDVIYSGLTKMHLKITPEH